MTIAGDDRPDPDAVLARLKRTAQSASRGRLRIYFGASAGVGKTYAMLQAARRLKAEGRDVLVGVVECHGRPETLALMQGPDAPPQLPLKTLDYRGHTLSEFDLDAALERHPEVLVVDELAHQNVPGSRHPKRWQDVEELLAAGIDVYTALNVQHLESLSEVVGGIAEVKVRETVPDTFFDAAHEVILVDVPADELLKRLESGKVYLPTEAERAAKNFFRRGNLMALRELALRRTADRLEDEVQDYRSDEAIKPVWRTEASMVCGVGPAASAETVVRAAARLASQTATSWHAVYVETPRLQRLSSGERERILGYVKLAQQLGARTTVLVAADGDVAARLVEYARLHNCSRILLGQRQRRRFWGRRAGIAQTLVERGPEMDLIEFAIPAARPPTSSAGAVAASDASAEGWSAERLRPYAWALAGCLASIAFGMLLVPFVHLTNLAMLFLLAVALTAMRWGRVPAIVSAVLNVAAYDFFFVPPRFSFAVSDIQYLFTFIVMLVVGLIIAELTARLRFQARVAQHREDRAQALYEFARDLSAALRVEDVVLLSEGVVSRSFRAEAKIIASGTDARLVIPPELARLPNFEPAIATWVFEKGESAGLGTDTLPGSSWLYVPLRAPSRTRGVLALRPKARRLLLVPEQARQLETFAALIAVALERVHYVSVAQDALVGMEGERLRNSILSAVSHDLRTPLAAVVGLADSLTLTHPRLSPEQQELAAAIAHEAHRMNALVNNLLDMARIESGTIHMNLQWQPIEEVIGSALQACRALLAGHQVTVSVAADLPLVQFDAVLIERVLVNLLENCAKYTPPGTAVRIEAGREGPALAVRVADNGPGLPRGREEALFAKFARGEGVAGAPGVGLGLTICRAIVEAHGGRIRPEPQAGPGSCFHFTLPLGDPPPVSYEADEDLEHV